MILLAAAFAPLPQPAAVVETLRAEAGEREVARYPSAHLRARMDAAWDAWTLDGTALAFALTPDPYEGYWLKVRQADGALKVYRKETLKEGVEDTLSGRRFKLTAEDDVLRVVLLEGDRPQAPLSYKRLLRRAFASAQQVSLGGAKFAVLREGFPLPDAVVLIRERMAGFLQTTFLKDEDLGEPVWFLYEGGALYAVGLDPASVFFLTKPAR